MIIVLFIVFAALIACGIYIDEETDHYYIAIIANVLGILGCFVSIVTAALVTITLIGISTVDERIAFYQQENSIIEADISGIVSDYMDYEGGLIDGASSKEAEISSIMIIPELNSNELVKKQMDTYLSNRQKISDLEIKKINSRPMKWWLFFGK